MPLSTISGVPRGSCDPSLGAILVATSVPTLETMRDDEMKGGTNSQMMNEIVVVWLGIRRCDGCGITEKSGMSRFPC